MEKDGNEDIYFTNKMRELGYKLPDKKTCNKFAVETEFALGSVGYHAIDKFHKNYKLILNQYESSQVFVQFNWMVNMFIGVQLFSFSSISIA